MTIFQKMLLVPVLSLLLYSGFIAYSYKEHQQSSDKIESIRDHYVPLLELVGANSQLFENLRDVFKDAVLASEAHWFKNATELKQKIENNLAQLAQYPDIVDPQELIKTQQNFSFYYLNVKTLAKKMIINQKTISDSPDLIHDVERYHNATLEQFGNLKRSIQDRFRSTLDETSHTLNQMLFWSMVISISSMVFLIVVMLVVSISTRRGLLKMVVRMKELALGNTDFSRRLKRKNRDEIGLLIHWFNKLSDKLESDYINIEKISITDKLTQLNNRTRTDNYFPEALVEAQDANTFIAAVLLDIDHFKLVNDNYGHLTGDKILKSLAVLLKNNAQQHDFIARWGGEEFIIILKRIDATSAYERMDKLREIIENHKFPDVDQVTVSFGLALSGKNDNPESIMQRADKCLYEAKEKGRNCVVMES